jgi:cytochrome P450
MTQDMLNAPRDCTAEFARDPLAFLRSHSGEREVRFRLNGLPYVLVNDVTAIHELLVTQSERFTRTQFTREALQPFLGNGLLTSDGAHHRWQRRLMQPAFHPYRIATYADLMIRHIADATSRWDEGQRLNVIDTVVALSLGVVTEALFGENASEAASDLHTMLHLMQQAQAAEFDSQRDDASRHAKFERDMRVAIGKIDQRIHALIGRRRAAGGGGGDLLAMLLSATDASGAGGMTDQQVRDEVITLFIAGHETTSVTLTWAFWLLGRHPVVYDALIAEVDAALGGGVPTPAQLTTLKLPMQIIRETLRLYPTAWILFNRLASDATTLSDIPITPGEMVMVSPYAVQRNAHHFENPDAFNPGHFAEGWEKLRDKFSYFPFGGGARICIGQHFALLEASSVLAMTAQRFRFRLLEPGRTVLPLPLTTLQPDVPVEIELARRQEK